MNYMTHGEPLFMAYQYMIAIWIMLSQPIGDSACFPNMPHLLKRIHETEHALCIDGVINKFMFQLDVLTNDLTAYNLWAFEDPNRKSFDGKREKADAVLKVFNEIKEVLLNNGVNSKYLDLYN